MILDDGTTEITFSPISGYIKPQDRNRAIHKAMDGTLYIYEFSDRQKWVIPVNAIIKVDYDKLLEWWQDMQSLTFTPDEAVPLTTYTVNIINSNNPLKMMDRTGWETLYEGVLTIREL